VLRWLTRWGQVVLCHPAVYQPHGNFARQPSSMAVSLPAHSLCALHSCSCAPLQLHSCRIGAQGTAVWFKDCMQLL
jgi:hypothetical protein